MKNIENDLLNRVVQRTDNLTSTDSLVLNIFVTEVNTLSNELPTS